MNTSHLRGCCMSIQDGGPGKRPVITGGFQPEKPESEKENRKGGRKSGGRYPPVFILVFCVSALLFIAGVTGLISYACRCGSTRQDNEAYRQLHSGAVEAQETEISACGTAAAVPEDTPAAAETPVPAPSSLPQQSQAAVPAAPRTAAPSVTFRPYYFDTSGAVLPEMNELYKINRDVAGWLEIPGVVDLPVVYRDNDYYLHRNLEGRKSDAGTLFLDENCRIGGKTQYLLIHGHNMKDGTMFAPVVHYKTKGLSFLKVHPFAAFSTLYEKETYVVFAVCYVSLEYRNDRYIPYYGFSSFSDTDEFNDYIRLLKSQSLYDIPVEVDASDPILVLSTCLNDDRLIVCFRRVRSNEWQSGLNSLINRSTAK
ncbi:MAG: hypothetical protein CW338_02690 [Clostridiales bacterium]|nr:hypothetical protein [Clostridiales bacterium]